MKVQDARSHGESLGGSQKCFYRPHHMEKSELTVSLCFVTRACPSCRVQCDRPAGTALQPQAMILNRGMESISATSAGTDVICRTVSSFESEDFPTTADDDEQDFCWEYDDDEGHWCHADMDTFIAGNKGDFPSVDSSLEEVTKGLLHQSIKDTPLKQVVDGATLMSCDASRGSSDFVDLTETPSVPYFQRPEISVDIPIIDLSESP